ncbi:hypothetical protein JYU34_021071 [Plutella xylostella]|uniref:Reverse transcriptase domain-containing protein n=1 Tax=Plutella xylostella TaxID=51655 RepID=A0ABQ7PSM9_PLUXY|nr:hypothetical protein JYU34_021071 [Plutella xylostella]
MTNYLSIYYQNARGLRTKTNMFLRNVMLNDYDIITITESWLLDGIGDAEIVDDRYLVWRRDRDYAATGQSLGGGVFIAVKREFRANSSASMLSSAEDLWVTISLKYFKLHICVLYLCSQNLGSNFSTQLINFTSQLTSILASHSEDKFLVLGDFNMSSITWLVTDDGLMAKDLVGTQVTDFIDLINFHNLRQFNSVQNNFGRILDLVFAHEATEVVACPDPFVPEDPYHKALLVSYPIESHKSLPNKPRKLFTYSRADYTQIRKSISDVNWIESFSNVSAELALDFFYNVIYDIREKFVPIRSTLRDKYPAWYSPALIKILKEKFKYIKKFKTYGNLSDYLSLKTLRGRIKDVERQCYNKYIEKIEESINVNPKSFWTYIKNNKSASTFPSTMTYKDTSSDSGQVISELFASFFYSTFNETSTSNVHNQFADFQPCCHISQVEILTSDVEKQLRSLDLNKSAGPDTLPAMFIVPCAAELSIPVSLIFKKILSEGTMPVNWKRAFISPIHKKGSKHKIDNYRPISKLCLLAKVLERLVYTQLYSCIKSSFSPMQHGFLKGRSTVSNLALFNDFVTEKMDGGSQVDVIYTDYSKAFDRIDHSLLLKKLSRIGVTGALLSWFQSYVTGRSQAVVLNGFTSSWINIPSGVPQGSLLGPLLFIIFINDINDCFRNSEYLMFADDMKIFKAINNSIDEELLQEDLDRLSVYCLNNKLDINVDKCFHISFTRKRNKHMSTYMLQNQSLTSVSEIRDLGVVHDSKLLFDSHIDSIITKASKALGFLIRSSRPFKCMKTVKILYCAYVRSHLEYASQIWNPQYDIYIDRLERIQKRFIRYLGFKFKLIDSSYECKCIKLHLLPLKLRRDISDIIYLIKIFRGYVDCPDLLGKLGLRVPWRRTRNRPLLSIPQCNSNYRQNSFLVRASNTFNQMCNSNSVDLFSGSLCSIRKHITTNFIT